MKLDSAKILSISVTVLGVLGTILSNKVQANDRKAMKLELKNELLEELKNE